MRLFRVHVAFNGESDYMISPIEIVKGYRNAVKRFNHLANAVKHHVYYGNAGSVLMEEFKDYDFSSSDGLLMTPTEIKRFDFDFQK